MLKKLLRYLKKRRIFILLGMFVVVSVVYATSKRPVSESQLVSHSWCSYPIIRWSFSENGQFRQAITYFGEFDGYTVTEIGTWVIESRDEQGSWIKLAYQDRDEPTEEMFWVQISRVGYLTVAGRLSADYSAEDEVLLPCFD